jgi:hypothetical protein
MVYCVVPRELKSALLEQMEQHYEGDPEVTVIVDRRLTRRRRVVVEVRLERRALRERRRRRVGVDSVALPAYVAPGAAA